jgi:hypothetical protein
MPLKVAASLLTLLLSFAVLFPYVADALRQIGPRMLSLITTY